MKPIKLTIDGINSFKDRQTLDFLALSSGLFCVCGDTGAGKSTILDAIILALYGECNRGDNVRGTDYINLERDKAEVEFEFEMEQSAYRIWREFARGAGGESKKKVKLFKDGVLIASQVSEAGRIIAETVGLSMDDFTQVVVLEQGKFSRFLTSSRKDRSITVSKLFHLDRYRDLYSKTDKALWGIKDKMSGIELVLAAFAEFTPEKLIQSQELLLNVQRQALQNDTMFAEASEKIKVLSQLKIMHEKSVKAALRRDVLEAEINRDESRLNILLTQVDKDKDKYEAAKTDKDKTTVELDRLVNLMPRISEKNECGQRLVTARTRYSELQKTADGLRANLERLEHSKALSEQKSEEYKTEISAFTDFCDPLSVKVQAEAIVKDFERAFKEILLVKTQLQECEKAEKTHRQILLRYQSDLEKFKADTQAKSGLLSAAGNEYQNRLTINSAAFVALALKSGDTCPVCGGTFSHSDLKTTDIEQARQAVDALRAEVKAAEAKAAELDGLIKVELSCIISEEKKKSGLNERLLQSDEILNQLKVKNPQDCERLLTLARDAYANAGILQKIAVETDKTLSSLTLTLSALEEQKARGIELKERIDNLTAEILQKGGENPEARRLNLTAQLNTLTAFISDYEKEQKAITAEIGLIDRSLAAKRQELCLLTGDIKQVDFSEDEFAAADALYKDTLAAKGRLAEETGVIKQTIERAKQVLAEKKANETELKGLSKTADRLDKLKRLFMGEKFLEFVADEYISNFTLDASVILNDISGGKYALVYEQGEGKFYVIDYLSGAKKRKVSTLSGGEVFLASLALALSIARHIASKNYDFFFLDEGFGTLDVKKMGMVADALARLARCGLVGVISHRAELVERIPARVRVVAAAEEAGSKIVIEC